MPQRNPAGKAREASREAGAPSSGRAPDGTAVADAPRADAPTAASWRRVNCVGMGHSAIELRPITSLLSPRECARQAVLFLESGRALRELSLGSKKSPSFLKGRGLSLTTVRYLKSPVSPSPNPVMPHSVPRHSVRRFCLTVPNFPIARPAR